MQLDFKKITLDDQKIYEKYRPFYLDSYGWEYSFAMTWIWNAFNETMIFDAGDMAFVSTKFFGRRVHYPPFLKQPKDFPRVVEHIEKACRLEGTHLDIRGLSKAHIALLDPDRYTITSKRGHSDYVYNTQDLILLGGKKFHSKRNFITRFKIAHPNHVFREYEEKLDRAAVFNLYHKWNTNTDHETLALEEKVIRRALDARKELGLKIGVLYAEDTLAAFSVSDATNPQAAHTFFEKADKDFVGSYQTINQLAAKSFLSGIPLVNRQEDLEIEGLRKAKLSYHPAFLVEKYRVQCRCDDRE